MSGDRIVRLDGLRFLAALAVVMFHYAFRGEAVGVMPPLGLPDWFVSMSKYGYLGVNLFFMISGFVIAWSAHGRPAPDFAAARLARLYPAHFAALTISFAVTLYAGSPHFSANWLQYAANLTMLAPFFGQPFMDGAYWSIALELFFYGWVFLFLVFGIFEKHCTRIVLVWLTIALFNEHLFHIKPIRVIFLTEFAGFFAAGILMYRWRAGLADLATLPLMALSLGVSMRTSLNLLAVIEVDYRTDYSDLLVTGLVIALYALVYAATSARSSRLSPRMLLVLGAVTYPLYLLHQHIGYIVFSALDGAVTGFAALALVISGMIILALLVWLFVEKPCIPAMRRALMMLSAGIANRLADLRPDRAHSADWVRRRN
jgi:peptidoglycan/LPS O-acetylase OafA/YrhL